MRFLRQMAFYAGMAAGVAAAAGAGAVVLTYLLTGRFPSVAVGEGQQRLTLMTPAEIVDLVHEQAGRARAAAAGEG